MFHSQINYQKLLQTINESDLKLCNRYELVLRFNNSIFSSPTREFNETITK